MRSLLNLILLVDLLFFGLICLPFPTQAAPSQLPAPLKQPAPVNKMLMGLDCLIYPFTARQTVVDGAVPGDTIDILDGPAGSDGFGWLAWNPAKANVSGYLADELQYPQLSVSDFYNNHDPSDRTLGEEDWVASLPGVNTSIEIQEGLLTQLIGRKIRIPVWDTFHTENTGGFVTDHYRLSSFIWVRIENSAGFNNWGGSKNIYATYLGEASSEQCPYLSLTKSGPATATAGSPITYTLTLTNNASLTATNLIITDAIPTNAVYIGGGTLVGSVVSWTVPVLEFGESLTQTFSVTSTSPNIINNNYRVNADGNLWATGSISVVTTITSNNEMRQVYLPIILKE